MLTAWLDYHRATLARKCAGLDDEQLRARSAPPSSLSLLGLAGLTSEVIQYARMMVGAKALHAQRLVAERTDNVLMDLPAEAF